MPSEAPIIHANAVYGLASATSVVSAKQGTLPREIRLGRLRVAKRGGRYYILGAWLLEWLAAGELKRDRRQVARQES